VVLLLLSSSLLVQQSGCHILDEHLDEGSTVLVRRKKEDMADCSLDSREEILAADDVADATISSGG